MLTSRDGIVGQIADALDNSGDAAKVVMPCVQIGGATYQLLTDAADDGDPVENIVGGSYIWGVAGDFGGTTVKLQYLGPDGETYIDVPDASLDAVGALEVRIGAGATIKAVVTGGAPAGLYSNLT